MGVQTERRERISLVGAIAWVVCFQLCAAQIPWRALCTFWGRFCARGCASWRASSKASCTSEASMAGPALPMTQRTTAEPIPLDQLSLRTRTASLRSPVDPRRSGYPGELHCRS